MMKILKPLLITLSLIPLMGVIGIALLFSGSYGTAEQADCAVVLGNKVELDGTPSKRLKARLSKATELFSDSMVTQIVVSGGVGKEGFDEARVMADYLIAQGVPDSVITIDSEGNNTHATATNLARLVGTECSVIAVSQQYHVSRSKLSLRNAGFSSVSGAFPAYFEMRDIYSYVREVPAWIKYRIKGL